jgi:thioredoxin 1
MEITSQNFEEVLEQSFEKPLLIDFWAAWCGPCRMLAPVMAQLEEEIGDDAIIGKVNVDEQSELARDFGIVSIPTIVVIKDKKIVNKSVGYKSLEQLKALLDAE